MRWQHVHSWTFTTELSGADIASLPLGPGHQKRQSISLGVTPECICSYTYMYVHIYICTHTSLPFTDLVKGCSVT